MIRQKLFLLFILSKVFNFKNAKIYLKESKITFPHQGDIF